MTNRYTLLRTGSVHLAMASFEAVMGRLSTSCKLKTVGSRLCPTGSVCCSGSCNKLSALLCSSAQGTGCHRSRQQVSMPTSRDEQLRSVELPF